MFSLIESCFIYMCWSRGYEELQPLLLFW